METDLERHLGGYNLPSDSLWEIKRLMERRYQTRFWEGMSPEGRAAMQQVIENDTDSVDGSAEKCNTNTKASDINKGKNRHAHDTRRKRTISFSDSYQKSASSRLDGDITDANFKKENLKKRAIGGKMASAMETIEIVQHGEAGGEIRTDENAISDTAKINSVEKCLVWMEVNDDVTWTDPGTVTRSATPKW